MSDCCTTSGGTCEHPRKQPCPLCGREGAEVATRTMTHHLRKAWAWQPTAARYFFCDDPACAAVYFGDDGSVIRQAELRTRVGSKENDEAGDSLLCYCFGVSKADFRNDPATKDFVIAQTKAARCSCDTSNPSGRCCLKDFPKLPTGLGSA